MTEYFKELQNIQSTQEPVITCIFANIENILFSFSKLFLSQYSHGLVVFATSHQIPL